jgi:hypothetical protein
MEGKPMSRPNLSAMILTAMGVVLACSNAIAQTPGDQAQRFRNQLQGVWNLVSYVEKWDDGSTVQPFGPNPEGRMILAANGYYTVQIYRSDLPKYKHRDLATADENKATVAGVISHFGRYNVGVSPQPALYYRIDSGAFAAENHFDHRAFIAINGDEMKYSDPGTGEELVWKRVK